MNSVINFIHCRDFQERMDEWLRGALPKPTQELMQRHKNNCKNCREVYEGWQSYFVFMNDIGRDVEPSSELVEHIAKRTHAPLRLARNYLTKSLAWFLQPVQAASIMFILVLTPSLSLGPRDGEAARTSLGNLMTVEAHGLAAPHTVIRYRWDDSYVSLSPSPVVLECFNGQVFSLYNPLKAESPILESLLTHKTHRGFFETWCSLIHRATGTYTCQRDMGCRLELYSESNP